MDYIMQELTYVWEEWRILILALIPIFALDAILMAAALVNLVKKPVTATAKIGWALAILFLTTIGPVIYLVFGSKQLDEKAITWDDPKEYGNFD